MCSSTNHRRRIVFFASPVFPTKTRKIFDDRRSHFDLKHILTKVIKYINRKLMHKRVITPSISAPILVFTETTLYCGDNPHHLGYTAYCSAEWFADYPRQATPERPHFKQNPYPARLGVEQFVFLPVPARRCTHPWKHNFPAPMADRKHSPVINLVDGWITQMLFRAMIKTHIKMMIPIVLVKALTPEVPMFADEVTTTKTYAKLMFFYYVSTK